MTDRPPKPEGIGWMSPYLTLKDVKKALEFYEKAFSFKTKFTIPDKEGNITHAELTYKDAFLMMGPETEEGAAKAPGTLKGTAMGLYFYVEDVDKLFVQAKNAGAVVRQEPTTQFWGDRTCSLTCPEGHHWTFATNVADFDPNNIPK